MRADGRASFGVVPNGNSPEGRLSERDSRDHKCSEADASNLHGTDSDTNHSDQALSQSADGDHTRRDITHRNEPTSVAASFIA